MRRSGAMGRGRAGWAIVAATLLCAVGAAEAEAGQDRYKRQLARALRKDGLELQELLRCRSPADRVSCRFHAVGTPPGRPAYECEGKAVQAAGRKWRVRRCGPRMVRLGPGKNPLFGYNEDWRNHQEKFDLLAGAGANVARQTLVWDDLQNPQFADWRYSDRVYADFLARGIRPLWVLFQDEISSARIDPPTPAQYDAYADVAARVAARYPNSAGIEIWNEPNLAAFWRSPDPVAYGELVRAATQAVHAVHPGMPVIAAGLFPVDATGTDGVAHDEFLRRAYETGGLQAADAIGAHPYPTGGYDDDYLATIRVRLYEQLETMSEFGDAGKPIWVTETGISTASGKDGFTYVQQADALAAIYAMLRRVANLPVVVFHRFVDDPYAGEIEAGYGVLSEYGVPKPAYCAVAELRGSPC